MKIVLDVYLFLDASSIYEQDAIGRSALVYAVHFKHQETVQILLEQGAEVNCCAHGKSLVSMEQT